MIISKCSKCGSAITGEGMGRQTLVTVEKFKDSGMSVTRRFLCEQHDHELMIWLDEFGDALDDKDLLIRAGVCGND